MTTIKQTIKSPDIKRQIRGLRETARKIAASKESARNFLIFSHPMWDESAGEIDSLLVSAKRQDELFARKGLTEKFVIHGQA